MNVAAFAELCGVSRQAMHKHADAGRVLLDADGSVDVDASLAALAGHLDEDKRRAALEKRAFETGATPPPPPNKGSAAIQTPKQELDALKAATLRLELAQKAGEVVAVTAVEAAIFDAAAKLRATFDANARALAEDLARECGLPPERAGAVLRRVKRAFAEAQNAAAQALAADPRLPLATGAPEIAAAAPQSPTAAPTEEVAAAF